MQKKLTLFSLLIFCLFQNLAISQTTFTATNAGTTCDGPDFCIDVVVSDFTEISNTQWQFQWDTSLITYVNLTINPGVGGFNLSNETTAPDGYMNFIWSGFPAQNLNDGDTFVSLCFSPNGRAGVGSLEMTEEPGVLPIVVLKGNPPAQLTPGVDLFLNPATITITDDTAPMIDCIGDITVNSNTPISGLAPTSFSDNCQIDSVSYVITGVTSGSGLNDASGSSFLTGMSTVTYTIVDFGGNTDQCSFVVTAEDPPSTTLEFIPLVTFDCDNDVVNLYMTVNNFTDLVSMQFTTIWDTADIKYINGSLVNNFPPTATFITGPTTDGQLPFFWSDSAFPFDGASLANGDTIFSASFDLTGTLNTPLFDTTSLDALPIEVVNTGGVMNPSEYSFLPEIITIIDTGDPTFFGCPGNEIITNTTDSCGAFFTWKEPTASDLCDPTVTITQTHSPGFYFPIGTTTVTYTATDDSGNSSICSFDITVNDTQLPTFDCPMDVTVSSGANTSAPVSGLTLSNLSDNCGIASVSYSAVGASPGTGGTDASGTYAVGNTEITFYVTDDHGNIDSCKTMVTVSQLPLPNLSCPTGPITQNTDPDSCNAQVININPISLTDPGAISSITYDLSAPTGGSGMNDASGELFAVGTTTVTYTITDTANQMVSCSFEVIIVDNQAPDITCAVVDAYNAPMDSCGMTVLDNLAPTVSDNCGVMSVTYQMNGATTGNGTNTATGTFFEIGTTTVTYTVTDENGNENSCTTTVVVNDTQAPSITCPNDTTIIIPAGSTSEVVGNIDPTSSDVCGIAGTSYSIDGGSPVNGTASNTQFNLGVTEVKYYVEDIHGNTDSCTFTVTLEEAPVGNFIDCPGNAIANNDPGECNVFVGGIAPIYFVDPASVDVVYELFNSNGTKTGLDDASGEQLPVGITTIRYIATDINGIADTCTFTMTVRDVEAPTWSNCPDTVRANVNPGECQANVNWDVPFPSDNCLVTNIAQSHNPGDLFPVGQTTVSYTAFDEAGNTGLCEFIVIVEDDEAPSVTCPTDFTYTYIDGCQAIVDWVSPTPSDNCPGATLTSTAMPGDTFDLESNTTVIFLAIDAAGLTGQCEFPIFVPDTIKPTIVNCPNDTIINTDMGLCSAVYNWAEPAASDNCTLASFVSSENPGTAFPLGTTTVTYTAQDIAGNTVVCSFDVTVVDNQSPTVTCPGTVEVRLDGTIVSDPSNILISTSTDIGCTGIKLSFLEPTGFDACDGAIPAVFTSGIANGQSFPLGTTTQTYSVTDATGNGFTCSFDIVVMDLAPLTPTVIGGAVCVGSDAQFAVTPTPNATYAWTGPGGWTATGPTPVRPNITGVDNGIYTVECTTAEGCVSTGSVELFLLPVPAVAASSNSPICTDGGSTLQLLAEAESGSIGIVSWSWSGPNNYISSDQNPVIPNADAANSGTYTVVGTSSNGCTASGTVEVSVVELPTPSIDSDCADVGCVGQECFLFGTDFLPSPDSYNWEVVPSANVIISGNTNSNEITMEPTEPGLFIVKYWVTSNGCVSDTALLEINVEGVPVAVNDQDVLNYESTFESNVLWNDSVTAEGVFVQLTSGVSNGQLELGTDGLYTYTPEDGFLGEDQFSYQICSSCDPTLCSSATVTLSVAFNSEECEVPSVITPNGDGTNDVLFINCLYNNQFPQNSIDIYNEWGDRIFEASPYQNDWGGTFNGDDLPDGTYFYIYKTTPTAEAKKGYVTIFR